MSRLELTKKSRSSSYSNSSGEKRRKTMLKSARSRTRKMNTVTIGVPPRQSTRYTWNKILPYIRDGYKFRKIVLEKPVK